MTPEELREFCQVASDPCAWKAKALVMRDAAQTIWDSYLGLFEDAKPKDKGQQMAVLRTWFERMHIAQLLYGLVVETGLKARIIADEPDSIEFREKKNGNGEVIDISITKIGVELGADGHDLIKLASVAGMLGEVDGELYKCESDRVAMREILAYLTDCVRWSSRYPAPKKFSERYLPGASIPDRILGHYMRDYLDPFLSKLLSD